MTYRTGSIGDFMRWTKRVIADSGTTEPGLKRWYDSEETAGRSIEALSPDAIVKLLSRENLELLKVIGTRRPDSLSQLAGWMDRRESNVSRTLKKLQKAGIVELEPGPGGKRAPRLRARRIILEVDLAPLGSQQPLDETAA